MLKIILQKDFVDSIFFSFWKSIINIWTPTYYYKRVNLIK